MCLRLKSSYLLLFSKFCNTINITLIIFDRAFHSFYNNYCNLTLSPYSAPGSHQLVFIVYYLVLSLLLMFSSSGLSTDVIPKKDEYIHTEVHNEAWEIVGFFSYKVWHILWRFRDLWQSVTEGRWSKVVKNSVTYFMDGPQYDDIKGLPYYH